MVDLVRDELFVFDLVDEDQILALDIEGVGNRGVIDFHFHCLQGFEFIQVELQNHEEDVLELFLVKVVEGEKVRIEQPHLVLVFGRGL